MSTLARHRHWRLGATLYVAVAFLVGLAIAVVIVVAWFASGS